MSNEFSKNEVNIYSHNEFHNNDHVVAHLANYMDRGQNPSDDLIHLTQKDDDSSASTASPTLKLGTKSKLNKKQPTSLGLAYSPSLKPIFATTMSTPTNTNDNAKNVTDTEVVNKANEKSLSTTSSVITPQFKGSSKAVANNTTHKINTGTSHNLANNKYYHSPYLKKEFKPTINSFELPPELKKLQPLIMSQHEAFSTLIKDLGNITLTLSKIIEKKKESYNLLKNDKKIPRSLRIKCELTTSPYYENDPDFLNLKDKLKEKVRTFMEEGTEIITEWANINIQRLLKDRCHDILIKALNILKGLTTFYAEIIGTPQWKSIPSSKYIPLFLLKFYFSNEYIDTTDIVNFLEIPVENILITITKLLTDATSDADAELILSTIDFDNIDPDDPIQEEFLSETLTCFDDILRGTTINLWLQHKDEDKQTIAAQNLKSQMKTLEIANATLSTAFAIAKATENDNTANSQQQISNLRISNLEKAIKRQEQKSNVIFKEIKHNHTQKNMTGSHNKGSVASPETSTLTRNKNKSRQNVIDLSTEDADETTPLQTSPISSPPYYKRTPKRQRKGKSTQPYNSNNKKTIQWKETESKLYNPEHPVANNFTQPQIVTTPFPSNINFAASNGTWKVPTLQNTPTIFVPQQQNPFGNQQYTHAPLGFQQPQQNIFTQNQFNPYMQHSLNTNRGNPFGTTRHRNHL